MARNYQQYLDAHDGNAEEALKAAVRDVAQRESQNTAARAFKRAYAPLVESLKLPVDVDTDSEQEAQALAARALDGLSTPDADAQATIEALRDVLDIYVDATGIDLSEVLGNLPDGASDEEVEARIAEAFAPLDELRHRATRADLQDAAAFAGKPVEALADYLEGKTWGKRIVKGEDGSEREEWGIGEGEAFRPLTEVPALRAIAPAQPDKPAPAPLPTGQRGGNARPVDPVQARIEARKTAEAPVDLLATPAPTQGGF